MHMIMSPENKIRSPITQFQSDLTYLISRSMAAFMLFVFTLWCLRVEYLSGFSISYFSFNLGRTHMFLVCNGIVFILLRSSVLATPDEDDDGGDQNVKKKKKNVEKVEMDCEVFEEKHVKKTEEIAVRNEKEVDEEDQTTSNRYVLIAETEQVDEQSVDEEEQEEVQGIEEEKEEDGVEELSVDELNKKCDEFIRRMRSVISNGNGFF